jgi:enamine deaminase RidA (YjgF/YER057c/UK114 family)
MAVHATDPEGNPCCSWCHLPKDRVAFLVASPTDYPRVYICDECIEVCHSILEKRRSEVQSKQVVPVSVMGEPEFFVTRGYGERQLNLFHYSQAVRVGNRIETSGQGGWDDDWHFPGPLADEIAQAFRNVERTLASAGASWKHVIAVNSYHLGFPEEVNEVMTERFRHYMPNHAPIWTALGVAAFGDPKMRVEIRVTAVLPG